jgi:hypothetical protein
MSMFLLSVSLSLLVGVHVFIIVGVSLCPIVALCNILFLLVYTVLFLKNSISPPRISICLVIVGVCLCLDDVFLSLLLWVCVSVSLICGYGRMYIR